VCSRRPRLCDLVDKMMVQLPLPPVPPPPRSTVVPSAPSKNPFDDDDDIDDLSPRHPLRSPTNARSGRALRHRTTPVGSGSSPDGSPTEPPSGPCQRCSDCCFKCTARCTRVLLVGPNLLFLVSELFSLRYNRTARAAHVGFK